MCGNVSVVKQKQNIRGPRANRKLAKCWFKLTCFIIYIVSLSGSNFICGFENTLFANVKVGGNGIS